MFVYFLAQLVSALLERQLRNAMREQGLSHLPILPAPARCIAGVPQAVVYEPYTGQDTGELVCPTDKMAHYFASRHSGARICAFRQAVRLFRPCYGTGLKLNCRTERSIA